MSASTYVRVLMECGHLSLVLFFYGSHRPPPCILDEDYCDVCEGSPRRQVVKVEMVDQRETSEFWRQQHERAQEMVKIQLEDSGRIEKENKE